MPFTMDWIGAGIRFGGYADGSDWVVVPTGGDVRNVGFAGGRGAGRDLPQVRLSSVLKDHI